MRRALKPDWVKAAYLSPNGALGPVNDMPEFPDHWKAIEEATEEYPFRLMVVNLRQDPSDPTVIFVDALVQSRSNEPIQISRGLALPLPLDIMGSTLQDALRAANQAPALGR